jgi:hypothetical protein
MDYFTHYGWENVSKIPEDEWLKEPLLKKLNSKFAIIAAGIIRMEPMRCYEWHKDSYRGVCLNMCLNPEDDSAVLFGERCAKVEVQ